jgi:hypothetical protein
VIQGSRGATALVGMPGLVVGAQVVVEGELWLYVETTADVVGCGGCGTPGCGSWPVLDVGAGPAGVGSPDGARGGQAPVALPRP